MPHTLLNNSHLKTNSTIRLLCLFLGLSIILGSILVWFGIADFDYRFSFNGQQQADDLSIQEQSHAAVYDQLNPERQQMIDQDINGQTFYFEDSTKQLPSLVSRENNYYAFLSKRTIDWTNPLTFGPILAGIVGLWLTWEATQHKRMSPLNQPAPSHQYTNR